MKFTALFGAALGLALSASTAMADVTVKWLHLETDPVALGVWDQIIQKFEAAHPGVKVQTQFLENEAFKAKLPTLLQSKDAPHLFFSWAGGVLKAQSETGAIMDLTADMQAEDGKWQKSYNPASVAGLTFDDKIWAVPYKMGTVSFFYNKELFQKAGVDADKIQTWDDFLAAVKKLKEAGIVPIAGGGGEKWPIHFYWSYLAMRNGGQEAFNAAKANEGDGFKAEPFIKAGEQLKALGELEPFQPGYLGTKWPQALGAFADGKAAMILGFEATEKNQANQAADGKGIAAANLGRFPFPTVEGGAGKVTDTLGGLNAWVISKDAPKEAVEFAAFLTNAENERLQAETGIMIPVAIGAEDGVKNPLVAESAKQLAASTWHQNFLDQDLGPAVGRVVNDVSVEIVSGQMSAEDAAQQIQDAWELEQ